MEKEIKDALNFAIGAAKSIREQADGIVAKIEQEFKQLSDKGAKDQGELATSLRKYVEEALSSVDGILKEVNNRVDEVKTKVIPQGTNGSASTTATATK